MGTASNGEHQRDSASLRVLGVFFTILGTTVLIATFWALDRPGAAIVNAVSGVVLVAIGIGMNVIAKRLSGRQNQKPS